MQCKLSSLSGTLGLQKDQMKSPSESGSLPAFMACWQSSIRVLFLEEQTLTDSESPPERPPEASRSLLVKDASLKGSACQSTRAYEQSRYILSRTWALKYPVSHVSCKKEGDRLSWALASLFFRQVLTVCSLGYYQIYSSGIFKHYCPAHCTFLQKLKLVMWTVLASPSFHLIWNKNISCETHSHSKMFYWGSSGGWGCGVRWVRKCWHGPSAV